MNTNCKLFINFDYLESTISKVVHIDSEVDYRIALANVVFCRHRENVW